MFFILSKILDFLLSPLIWVILVFIYSYVCRKSALGKKLFLTGLTLLLFFSNSFIINEAFLAWEGKPIVLSKVKNYEIAIVLTGVTSNRKGMPERVFFGKGADRVLHTIQLYRLGKIKKILISGGSGTVISKSIPEAGQLKKVFIYCGIPSDDILIEDRSRNTVESSKNCKVLINSLNLDKDKEILLITSAFHLPRSLGCFRKAGLKVHPYSVDPYSNDRNFDLDTLLLPSVTALGKWSILIHEMFGFLVYGIMGYT